MANRVDSRGHGRRQLQSLLAVAAIVVGIGASASCHDAGVRVAVFDFADDGQSLYGLGSAVADSIAATLSSDRRFVVLERQDLAKIFEEHGVKAAAGQAETNTLGNLAIADVQVRGRIYRLGEKLVVATRLINTQTSQLVADTFTIDSAEELLPQLAKLGETAAKTLSARSLELATRSATAASDLVSSLPRVPANRERRFFVRIAERSLQAGPAVDPAVATEVSSALQMLGAVVIDPAGKFQSDWPAWLSRAWDPSKVPAGTHVAILGEAVAEPAGNYGRLYVSRGRIELRAVDARSGKVLSITRRDGVGVDIATVSASKRILATLARESLPQLLTRIVMDAPVRPSDD